MNSEKYIGLDVHQATVSVAVLDCSGKLVMESILETKAALIVSYARNGIPGPVTYDMGIYQQRPRRRTIPRMKAALVLVTVVTVAALCAAAQVGSTPATQARHCAMSAEEQAVVVAYFNTPALSKNLLGFPYVATMLADTTEPTDTGLDLDYVNLQLAAKGRAIPAEARTDFSRKARENCGVGVLSGLRDVRVISDVSSPVFHRRYGKEAVLVRVSRVGFNSDRTIAVMHVSYYAQRSGGGCLYVFGREAGRWVMKAEFPSWTT